MIKNTDLLSYEGDERGTPSVAGRDTPLRPPFISFKIIGLGERQIISENCRGRGVCELFGQIAFQDKGSIRSPKTEGIGQAKINARFPRCIRHIIQVTFRVRGLIVDRGWHDLVI